ncbi:MAG: LysR family transcriptional regulator [Burkholderiales bacterium]
MDRRLQVFHMVAKQLSFTKAGELLYMTQPAVTFQIKQLENHFNTRLFDRSHGKITLTASGKIVLEYTERILNLTTEMETRLGEMTGQVSGTLLLGASTTIAEYMLPRILGDFQSRYPQVHARLIVANSETIEMKVADHTLDVGMIEGPSHQTSLTAEVCGQDELVMICAPHHALAGYSSATPALLTEQPLISREAGSGTREVVDEYFKNAGIPPVDLNIVMELGSPEAIKGTVETGLGIAVVSRASVTKELNLGDLVAIPLDPPLRRPLSLIYEQEKFRSRLLQVFLEFVTGRMQTQSIDPT